jgi:hypothetical protein
MARAQSDVKTKPRTTIRQCKRRCVPQARNRSKTKSKAPETIATTRTPRETIQ